MFQIESETSVCPRERSQPTSFTFLHTHTLLVRRGVGGSLTNEQKKRLRVRRLTLRVDAQYKLFFYRRELTLQQKKIPVVIELVWI